MSGGQRQRVAVGRAIVRKPDVFLFDEPLSNLDAKLRVSMRVRIVQLHKDLQKEGQNATMVYVTHDQVEAMTMGDRICVLKDGIIMQVDKPMNLYSKPSNKFVAGFIGSPAMNILEAELVEADEKLFVQIAEQKFELPKAKAAAIRKNTKLDGPKKIWFGLRPEDIETAEDSDTVKHLSGEVRLLENMGSETFCYFRMDEERYIAKLDSNKVKDLDVGDKFNFTMQMTRCHIFDRETEVNISLSKV